MGGKKEQPELRQDKNSETYKRENGGLPLSPTGEDGKRWETEVMSLLWFWVLPEVKPVSGRVWAAERPPNPYWLRVCGHLGISLHFKSTSSYFSLNEGRVRTSSAAFAPRFRYHSVTEVVQVPSKGYEQNVIIQISLTHKYCSQSSHTFSAWPRDLQTRWLVACFAKVLSSCTLRCSWHKLQSCASLPPSSHLYNQNNKASLRSF